MRAEGQEDAQYIGTDGRRKYTWEEVFRQSPEEELDDGSDSGSGSGSSPPWTLGFQASEKRLNFNADMKARLQKVMD